jgi:uncharacterized membrane protein
MFIKLYAIALPIFFLIDLVWIGVIAKNLYKTQIGSLMKPDINWIAAIIFYLIFISALIVFVISPAVVKQSIAQAAIYGAFFGLVTYSTYDLTNLALAKDWPLTITLVDLAWGTFVSTVISVLTYLIYTKI